VVWIQVFQYIQDAYDLEIKFGLGETRSHHVVRFDSINMLNVIFDNTEVRWKSNLIGCYDKSLVIIMNKISQDIRLNALESSVNTRNMFTRRWHKIWNIVVTHGDNNLSSRSALCYHINARLFLSWSVDCSVNVLSFFTDKLGKFSLIFKTSFMLADKAWV